MEPEKRQQIAPPTSTSSFARSEASPTSQQSRALPSAWIDRLFQRLGAYYGSRLAQLYVGQDMAEVRQAWAEGLAGLTGEELAQGLRGCLRKPWPPTMPEFRTLCLPDPEVIFQQAQSNPRGNPLAYWTLHRFGYADAQRLTWEQARERWTRTMHELLEQGVPPVPAQPTALAYDPAPASEETRAAVRDLLEKLKRG